MRDLLERQGSKGSQSDPSQRPRFLQIADEIRNQIASGVLKEHDILASERSLSEQHQVSRMTGRRALEALESEGLVYSADRRGRFVSPKRLNYNVSNMVSFVRDAQSGDVDLKIEVVDTAESVADSKLAGILGCKIGADIIEYTRLFQTSEHPIFLETEYLLADRFSGFLTHDLCQSTTRLLEEEYGTMAQTGDIVIRMRGAQGDEAALLNIAASHAVVELEQVIRDDTGAAFCFGRQVWRGEMAEFSAHAVVTPERRV